MGSGCRGHAAVGGRVDHRRLATAAASRDRVNGPPSLMNRRRQMKIKLSSIPPVAAMIGRWEAARTEAARLRGAMKLNHALANGLLSDEQAAQRRDRLCTA